MDPILVKKIKEITKERDLAKSVLSQRFHFQVEKEYRDAVVKMVKEMS